MLHATDATLTVQGYIRNAVCITVSEKMQPQHMDISESHDNRGVSGISHCLPTRPDLERVLPDA